MSGQVELIAILTPRTGAIDQVIEALSVLNKHVEANEPGVLRYEMYKQINSETGTESLVYIEVYKNKAALEEHRNSETYKTVQAKGAELQLLAAPLDVKILEHVGGFGLREG